MTNLSVFGNSELTMSSREIADLVEKRHDNVKRTIETLIGRGVISHPQIEDGQKSANGTAEKIYRIGKRDSYVIVAQLSPEFTARLVDRWQELESSNQFKLPTTLAEALRLAADQAELIENQQKAIALAAPKVEFYDAVAGSKTAIDIGSAAKILDMGIGRNRLFQFLREHGVLQSSNEPYHKHIDAGHFRLVEQKFQKPSGETVITKKTIVYQRGLDYIRKLIQREMEVIQ